MLIARKSYSIILNYRIGMEIREVSVKNVREKKHLMSLSMSVRPCTMSRQGHSGSRESHKICLWGRSCLYVGHLWSVQKLMD